MHLKISNKLIMCSYATSEGSRTPNASSAKNRAPAPCARQEAASSGAEESLAADYQQDAPGPSGPCLALTGKNHTWREHTLHHEGSGVTSRPRLSPFSHCLAVGLCVDHSTMTHLTSLYLSFPI